jgi:Type I restriction modification DNA specificity domain
MVRSIEILDTQKVLPEYLAIFLQTPLAQQQMQLLTTGSVIPVLANPNLSELKVYLPNLTKQREIISVFRDSAIKPEAKFKISFYNAKQAEVALMPTATQTQVKEELELPKASWQQIVQLQLPFPIARPYTLILNSEYQPYNMRLKALINLSESIVYYIYNVLVADQLRRLKLDDTELSEKIEKSFTSYSINSRLDVIFRMLNFVQKHSDVDLFIPEFSNIDIGVCRAFQNDVRNKWSHTSSFPEHKCKQIIIKYLPQFEKLLQTLLFLKEYNLSQVLHITIRNNLLQHHVISMMGNNSLFQRNYSGTPEPGDIWV